MLWRFFADTTPDRVTPAVVLAYAHGIGLSGKHTVAGHHRGPHRLPVAATSASSSGWGS